MKTIAFIIPYFTKGKELPTYFPLWLSTCQKNATIDFIFITDDRRNYVYPPNVKKIVMDFGELKPKIQKIFNFPINLDTPYKLCDYKPAYGEIFSQYLTGYDYWGYCDIDLFWGNIRHFKNPFLHHGYENQRIKRLFAI